MSVKSRPVTDPAGPAGPLSAGDLRRLAEQRRKEGTEDHQRRQHDALWSERRAELGPQALDPIRRALVRRAMAAAQAGELGLVVDLGVNEDRLRESSGNTLLSTTEALLSPRMLSQSNWDHSERIGWLLQTKDGKQLTAIGEQVVTALKGLGFQVQFSPFHVKDAPANPYHNATLTLSW